MTATRLPEATRAAVLGWPIAHSRSPRIHAAAYRALGLPWRYGAVRVGEAGLSAYLAGRDRSWVGFSLTMPLKDEAHRIAATLDPVAAESGVVNTLLRLDDAESGADGAAGPGPRWAGFNTDVAGLAGAIERAGFDATRTVVLGAGATAVSAVLAARRLGARSATLLARRPEAAQALGRRFDGTREPREGAHELAAAGAAIGSDAAVEAIASATLIVSTLPGPAGAELELPAGITGIPLYDVAYDPWPSPLARRWEAAGGVAHAGLDMLVEQALVQVRIFTSGDPERPLPDEERVLAEMSAAAVS